ncbi:FkbM family methyltransferase [Chitinophaga sp. Cy-1792]|uniref:FkbM family methyltransferase n=1 Tax=Chitinophaga sp. Cy-1792 TaxID=2608339 RepID=UPI001423D943|nr:FkbM family methyltransferase [Chitinophaga sp. Cy-1792]
MNTIQSIKNKLKVLTGKISSVKVEVDIHREWYGNAYGGFYVHPDKLNNQSVVYSFGIGEDISFDTAIMQQHGAQVFAFDPTPKSINWIKKQPPMAGFRFQDYGLGATTGFVTFNLPKNADHVSGSVADHKNVDSHNSISVPMKSFADIVKEFGHTHIDVLKMDIEGSEYAVVESILASPVKIDQILVEIHERFYPDGKARTQQLLNAFKAHGYKVFGVSDSLEEISFIKIN